MQEKCAQCSVHMYMFCPAPDLFRPPTDRTKRLVRLIQNLPHDLIEDTTCAPHVHLKAVVAVGQEALWSSVPARGDVLGVRRLGVNTPARAKVAELQAVMLQCE